MTTIKRLRLLRIHWIRSTLLVWFVSLLTVLVFTRCSSEDEPEPELIYIGSWTQGWPELGHDGEPYESDRVIVYSNYSSQESRKFVAEMAEAALDDILVVFEITFDDFTFHPNYKTRKIHIFSDYGQMNSSGLAYRDGIIVRAPDSPQYITAGYTEERWQIVLQHELTHVMEFLLIGDPDFQQANYVWLREGGANYGARNHAVQTIETLDAWQEQMKDVPDKGNPINVQVWGDFPPSVLSANTTIEYYKFFELATRYLVDPNGNGTTIENLKTYYEELGEGFRVDIVFERNFGITRDEFESGYWDLMREYLEK